MKTFALVIAVFIVGCTSNAPKRGFMEVESSPGLIQTQASKVMRIWLGKNISSGNGELNCTAFLVSADQLMTAEHCLSDFVHGTSLEKMWLNGGNFQLSNFKDEIIFDTAEKKDKILNVSSPCKLIPLSPSDDYWSQLGRCDFILLKLSRTLSVGVIPLAKAAVKPGDPVYIVGYPSKTKYFAKLAGGLDSTGDRMFVTRPVIAPAAEISYAHRREIYGTNVDNKSYSHDKGMNLEFWLRDPEYVSKLQTGKIWSVGDCYYGFSGSPVLNEEGEWVGVHSTSERAKPSPELGRRLTRSHCIGISAEWIKNFARIGP